MVPYGASIKPVVTANGKIVRGSVTYARRAAAHLSPLRAEIADGGQRVPLLVALHGRGGSAKGFENHSGFDALAEANKFLVVYPDGTVRRTSRAGASGMPAAVAARLKDALDNVNDVGFISMLIDKIKSEYNVDQKRVFAAGHSNGAMMGLRLACQLSNKIVAVGVQSGTLFVNKCPYKKPVAVLEIHGTADHSCRSRAA